MILVDTSVWIDHLKKGDKELIKLLDEDSVLIHTMIIEEIACGHLIRRHEILNLLEVLPKAPEVNHAEYLEFIWWHRLYGTGLGAIDIHLLASARLARAMLWTRDNALRHAATKLEVSH